MRAKVSIWARGLAAVAAVGITVVLLGAGSASATASHSAHAVRVAAGQSTVVAAVQADEGTWS